MPSVTAAQRTRARNLCMQTLLQASDYIDTHPQVHPPLEFSYELIETLIDKVKFKTAPREGSNKDITELVVGRDVYGAMTTMEDFTKHMTVNMEHFVKAGSPVLYKGLLVTTDAVLAPNTWILHPRHIFACSTRVQGSQVIRRPWYIEVDIPALDMADIFDPYVPLSKRVTD